MANEFGASSADLLFPELWAPELMTARDQILVAKKAIRSELFGLGTEHGVKKQFDTINIQTQLTKLTANNVGSDGSVTNQTKTISQIQLVVNQWKEVTVDVVDIAKIQANIDVLKYWSGEIGYTLGEIEDTFIMNLSDSASITQILGDQNSAPDVDQAMIAAIKILDKNKVPKKDRWFLAYADIAALIRGKDKFMSAMHVAYDKNGSPIVTGELPPLYGLNIQYTTNVQTGGTNIAGRRNLVVHKDWAAHASQRDINIETLARTKKSTPISGDSLYGGKLLRADHVVVMLSNE